MDGFDDEGDTLLAGLAYDEEDESQNDKTKTSSNVLSQDKKTVQLPSEFPFPFEPYSIQQDFMAKLYTCLELGKVGIFESPTGTGKSLSLICGTLRWLKDFQEKQRIELEALTTVTDKPTTTSTGELDWISEFSRKKEREEQLETVIREQDLLKKQKVKVKEWQSNKKKAAEKRKQMEDEFDELMKSTTDEIKKAYTSEMEKINDELLNENQNHMDDEAFLVADYESDDEKKTSHTDDDDDEDSHITKIYYCSRTHSQLSQFVREVIKSPYGDNTRVITLGSRQNLCINESVKKLKNISLINDTCLDMQKSKTKEKQNENGEPPTKRRKKGSTKCPFYKQETMEDLKDQLLMEVMDMEQIVSAGKKIKGCPYYGTRYGIPLAEIVALPYNILLHKSTREACGIKVQGNIVLVDEAHNLLETINNIHSMEVSGAQLLRAHSQLTQYETRYRSRLKAKNLMYIKQIIYILDRFIKTLGGKVGMSGDQQCSNQSETKLSTINDFLSLCQVDNLNMFKVLQYCQKSLISRKLNGFVEKFHNSEVQLAEETKEDKTKAGVSGFLQEIKQKVKGETTHAAVPVNIKPSEDRVVMRSPLMHIEGFLLALTNADKDGRIVITKQTVFSQTSMKYLLLNPAIHFSEIAKEARAVVVAGGTMQPVSDFKEQLFHSVGILTSDIMEFSCGHVIPSENLLAVTLATGPSGYNLDFTYQSRDKFKLLNELGMLIQNVCQVVPGGIVCFFPSYDYQRLVLSHWEKTGMLIQIGKRKKVFQEPKKAGQVDMVLGEFASCIRKCQSGAMVASGMTGALLFCVVGGKMSEGINFSDDLGRCVMMVGLPYPNIKSPELQEKMAYLNANYPKVVDGRLPGQVHYENLCMKAVNQSIGRAVRHRNDYATIVLLDQRYSRQNVTSKLPDWIRKCLQKIEKFGPMMSAFSRFFAQKKLQ